MKLHHLRVRNFRCIKALDWPIAGDFVCLVGPGDCGKSTILDALELAMSPRWNPIFDDSDFYNGSTAEPITIDVTVGDVPRRLLSDGHFGLRLRGRAASGEIHDEPQDGDEEVITIRLSVDASLEPVWEVVTDRHPEGAPIHARDREQLGVVRLGAIVDRHLSWSRGSVLARLTGETDEHADLLADAARKARSSMDLGKVPKLDGAAKRAASLASAFGVTPTTGFRPGLDPATATIGSGGLSLHDGLVPVRRAGLGTRRLITLAVEREIAREGGIVLVDEVEHGLEPFRIRRLLRELLQPSPAPQGDGGAVAVDSTKPRSGAAIVTTHSPVVLGELDAAHLRVVRRSAEAMTILAPPDAAQPAFRSNPEAFLSRRVIVCEGKTELGVLRGLDEAWSAAGEPFAARGVGLADGGGASKVGGVASVFVNLAYPTAVLADADVALDVEPAELRQKGILVVQWGDGMAVEQRVFADLPWSGVVEAVRLAIQEHGEEQVRAQFASALMASVNDVPSDIVAWQTWRQEAEVRTALGVAAKSKHNGWYKRVDLAAPLGKLIAQHLDEIEGGDLAGKINTLREWIFGA